MPPPIPMVHTEQAIQAAAELVRWAWIQLAEGSDVPHSYIAGLESPGTIVYPYQGDPLAVSVVNTFLGVGRIEYGFSAYHLPSHIDWGHVLRHNRAGRPYLFIPFTHGAYRGHKGPARTQVRAMPPAIYRVARQLQSGQYLTAGPTGGRALHAPGMQPYRPAFRRNIRPGYQHAAMQERMVRRPGRGRGSTYLTFRTMTPDSQGWWIPGRTGVELARQAQQDTAPAARAMLETAVRQDMEAALRQSIGGRR